MVLVLNRILSVATLMLYAVLSVSIYKIYLEEPIYISVNKNLSNFSKDYRIKRLNKFEIKVPKVKFQKTVELKPDKKLIKKNKPKKEDEKKPSLKVVNLIWKEIESRSILEFFDQIKLKKFEFKNELPKNLLSIYRQAPIEVKAADILKISQAKTKIVGIEEKNPVNGIASALNDYSSVQKKREEKEIQDVDVEFYDYSAPVLKENTTEKNKIVEAVDKSEEIVEAVDKSEEIVEAVDKSEEIVEAVDKSEKIVEAKAEDHFDLDRIEYVDLTEAVDKSEKIVEAVDENQKNVDQLTKIVQLNGQEISTNNKVKKIYKQQNDYSKLAQLKSIKEKSKIKNETAEYSIETEIRVIALNLENINHANGFDLNFLDSGEVVNDYNMGSVKISEQLTSKIMNRSVYLSKNGLANTHVDITLEHGWSELTIPMLEEETFKTMIKPYEHKGLLGALLVELDDETDKVEIDVPYGKVIKLNDELKITESDECRYALFIGVRPGNALIKYTDRNNKDTNKIVHIHEYSTTFEPNIYELGKIDHVELLEEDILSKVPSKLIITENQIRKFASQEKISKKSDNLYKINNDKKLLGARNYLELNHLDEPIFVGYREHLKLQIPSENLMRHVLRNLNGNSLNSRCVIQMNLEKSVEEALIGVESVENSTSIYVQYLDDDGKFYDSPGPKTRKIIIVGELNASGNINSDSKLNIKLNHSNQSSSYVSTYCSPNTYLVEQL